MRVFARSREMVLGVALIAVLGVPLESRALPGGGACGGSAPATTSCTTGSHLYTTNFVSNPTPGPNYVGTLQVKLLWAGGNRTTRCNFPGGGCTTTGSPLPPNTSFTHTCDSFTFATSTPGGSGVWACVLAYV